MWELNEAGSMPCTTARVDTAPQAEAGSVLEPQRGAVAWGIQATGTAPWAE